MILSNVTGAAAYAAVQGAFGATDNASGDGSGAASNADGSFGAMLQGAMTGLSDLGHQADVKSAQGMTGKANLTDVVMAVSKAEMALQATVAVRDKVVSAYQDVMRMAV